MGTNEWPRGMEQISNKFLHLPYIKRIASLNCTATGSISHHPMTQSFRRRHVFIMESKSKSLIIRSISFSGKSSGAPVIRMTSRPACSKVIPSFLISSSFSKEDPYLPVPHQSGKELELSEPEFRQSLQQNDHTLPVHGQHAGQ